MSQAIACRFCGGPNSPERVEIGKDHCMDIECVARWRRDRIEEKNLALVFVHKQGMAWIDKGDVPKNDLKRAGGL